jgi:hypothetical protein
MKATYADYHFENYPKERMPMVADGTAGLGSLFVSVHLQAPTFTGKGDLILLNLY